MKLEDIKANKNSCEFGQTKPNEQVLQNNGIYWKCNTDSKYFELENANEICFI